MNMFKLILKKMWPYFLAVLFTIGVTCCCFYQSNKNFEFISTISFYTSIIAFISPIISYILDRVATIKSILNQDLKDKISVIKNNFQELKSAISTAKMKVISSEDKQISVNECSAFNDLINQYISNIENCSLRIFNINACDDKKEEIFNKDVYKLLNKISNHRDNIDAIESLYNMILAVEDTLEKKFTQILLENA